MKATIDVTDRKEADLIKSALDDPTTRAYVQIMGALYPLTTKQRARVLVFVEACLEEDKGMVKAETESALAASGSAD